MSHPSVYLNREFPYIFVYCFFCRYLVELGLPQLGLPVAAKFLGHFEGFLLIFQGLKGAFARPGLAAYQARAGGGDQFLCTVDPSPSHIRFPWLDKRGVGERIPAIERLHSEAQARSRAWRDSPSVAL